MLAEVSALYQEWNAAELSASRAEAAWIASWREGQPPDASDVERMCVLREEASRRLLQFLAAVEQVSRAARYQALQ